MISDDVMHEVVTILDVNTTLSHLLTRHAIKPLGTLAFNVVVSSDVITSPLGVNVTFTITWTNWAL